MASNANDGYKNANTALEYGRRLLEFGFMNTTATLEGARKLTTAKSPQEYFQILTDLTREQFERLSEQVEELSALATSPSQLDSEKTETGFWD